MRTVGYDLTGWRVEVSAADAVVFSYLDAFYDRAQPEARRDAEIVVTEAMLDRDGLPEFLFQPARLHIRRRWLQWLQQHTAVNLHASAVDDGEQVVIYAGNRYCGKTTLMLDTMQRDGYEIVTNDDLILFNRGGQVILTTWPTYYKVRREPARRFHSLLQARIASTHGRSLWRRYLTRPEEVPFHGEAMIAPAGFGRARQPVVLLSARRVTLVDVCFAPESAPTSLDQSFSNIADFLWQNLKWSSGPDVAALIARFSAQVELMCFRHHGDATMLLERLVVPTMVCCGDQDRGPSSGELQVLSGLPAQRTKHPADRRTPEQVETTDRNSTAAPPWRAVTRT